ncbi:unnamed protein product [Adineta ricciae]|uniref:Methyltransferase domain-containing protein n=1 Tax=Adineta ricciae TaxID=249248 RepID=A0A815AHG9_ADIRI|nr:unnamed protein product [Adineta ricciae]
MIGTDRARRIELGTRVGLIGTYAERNPLKKCRILPEGILHYILIDLWKRTKGDIKITFNALDLKCNHTVVDLGCGPGQDSLWLSNKKMNKEMNLIASDISSGMMKILDDETHKRNLSSIIKTYCFYEQLDSNDNKLLIIGRPPKEIFPFDKRTQEIFLSSIPSTETCIQELEICGFANIQYDVYRYTSDGSITLEHWINFIQNRLWSIFSPEHMTDEQITDCIFHLKAKYKNEQFQFPDEMLILHCTAKKSVTQ